MAVSPAPKKNLYGLFSKSKIYRFRRGEIILRPGDSPAFVYYIRRGFMRIYSVTEDGAEKLLIFYEPNEIFPLILTLSETENKWYYEAHTDIELYRVTRGEFVEFIKSSPDILFEITNQMSSVLGIFSGRIDVLEYMKSHHRLVADLIFLSESFGEGANGELTISIPLTHRDLASRLAMTRETVSREMKKLENKKLVEHKNGFIVIKSIDKLQKELENEA